MRDFLRDKIAPHLVAAALLSVATLAVYLRILGHDFQLFWDDEKYFVANEAVKGFSAANLRHAFGTVTMGNYAPLHAISYMLDYELWGSNRAGFFLSNIALHLGNGLLFYLLLLRLEWDRLWAFLAAALFLLHPVQVESVAWVSERKNLLALFCCLSAFHCYLCYQKEQGARGKGAYLATFLLFAAALLAKSIAVVFPPLILLYDLCYQEKPERRRWLSDKIPFLLAAAAVAWLTIQSQGGGEIPGAGGGRTGYHGGSPWATFLTMLTVLMQYFKLLLWPAQLSALYNPPVRSAVDAVVLCGGAFALLLLLAGVALFLRQRRAFFWYALFFVTLLPVSQIVPIVTLMNDRYLYFPMLGVAGCLGSLACRLPAFHGARRLPALAAAGLVLLSLAVISHQRAGVWQSELTLWRDAAHNSPGHEVALYGLAQALQNSGDLDAAQEHYRKVLALNPGHLDALSHMAALYRSRNLPLAGRGYLLEVTRRYPGYAKGFLDLGANYYLTDDLSQAEKAFRRGQQLEPDSAAAARHLGLICLKQKRIDAAREQFLKLVALGRADAEVHYNLACVEALAGDRERALRYLEAALRSGIADRASVENDRDLDALRTLPAFNQLLQSRFGAR